MKKFKQFIMEEKRRLYKWEYFPPSLVTPPDFPAPLPYNPNNPWALNPYLEGPIDPDPWNPYGGIQNWGFGFENHNFEDLPLWLKALWYAYGTLDFLPVNVGLALDILDIIKLINYIRNLSNISEAQKEELVRQFLQFLRDKGIEFPDSIVNNPQHLRKMFYEARPDGKFQLWRWNPSTRTWEPFGAPVDNVPDGWEGPILAPWQMPKMPGPGQGVIPSDFRPEDVPVNEPGDQIPFFLSINNNQNQNQGQGGLDQFGG